MSHADGRGLIEDIVGPVDCVTRIHTLWGAVRGNHVHEQTVQWTYVVSGCLLMASGERRQTVRTDEMVCHEPGVPHAWKALEDTICLVFTRGPRGEDYGSDTIRLDKPLL